MNQLPKAIAYAANVHADQWDKGGSPYILHPIRVMQDVGRVLGKWDSKIQHHGMQVAVMHDVIEDTETSRSEVRKHIRDEFGDLVLENLEVLTRKSGQDYFSYVQGIIDFCIDDEIQVTIIIKMADLRDNMAILRQPSLDDKALLRIQRYHMAYRMLRDAYRE